MNDLIMECYDRPAMWCGSFSADTQYSVGDICRKNGEICIYCGNEIWEVLTDYIEMGGNYQINHMLNDMKHPANCKCCGAILKSNICEYCGAKYFEETV